MLEEKWLPISWAPGYFVSDQGRVLSHRRKSPFIRAQFHNQGGYHMVTLQVDGTSVARTVHRMVAEAFIGPLPDGKETRHIDGNKSNNTVNNLAYGTKSENMLDQVRHGVHSQARKTHCPLMHPYDELNTYHLANGRRRCRKCHSEYVRRYRAARKQVAA